MKIRSNHHRNRHAESGNMILALFAAVALVGTIGASTTMVMRGPMKVMSEVNQKTMTESQIMLSSKMIMLDTANLAAADCDGDKLNEPRPWIDAAGAGPDGVADSNGGGLLPKELGVNKNDTWGNPYGYCVWDHGALIDDVACGDTTQLRLEGTNDVQYPVIAVISSGANGTFETPCRDFSNADNDSNGSIEDVGDDKLINRGGDDIVVTYSYAEASKENPSLWELEYDADGNVLAVMDGDVNNVQFSGSNTAFGGNLKLDGAEGLLIPDENDLTDAECVAATEGQIRRNMVPSPILEICEDIGGAVYDFVPLATGSSGASVPDTTISSEEAGPGCVPTAKSMSVADELINTSTLDTVRTIRVKGKYAFIVSTGNQGITSLDISDSNNIIELDNVSNAATMDFAVGLEISGNYAYVTAKDSDSLTIIDISDPTNMVELDSYSSANLLSPIDVKISGNYAFVTDETSDGIISFDVSDPTNIIELDNVFNTGTMNTSGNFIISGNYAFIASANSDSITSIDISDPSNMIELDSLSNSTTLDRAYRIVLKDSYAYVMGLDSGNFAIIDISDPTNMVERGSVINSNLATGNLVISGNYVFLVTRDTNSIAVLDILDIDNPNFLWVKDASSYINGARYITIDDNYLFVSSYTNDKLAVFNICAEEYQGQVTVAQTATTGTTIGSVGWSQTLASDVDGDEAGIAFVIDKNAHKGSAPMAALSAVREGEPALAGLAFKTKGADGLVDASVYLGTNGRLGLGVTPGDSTKLFSDIQFGDHGPASWNNTDYLYGALITSDSGVTDQIAYFGFEGLNDASNTVLFSKELQIKKTDITGVQKDKYLKFDSTQATTFFGDIFQQSEGNSTRLQHKSYSNTGGSDGELVFQRARGANGAPEVVEQGDVLGEIKFGADKANSTAPTISAEVVGSATASNVPTDLIFKTGKQAQCIQQDFGPFVQENTIATNTLTLDLWGDGDYLYLAENWRGLRVLQHTQSQFTSIDIFDTPGNATGVWGDGTYIYVADDFPTAIQAYSFDGTLLTQEGAIATTGNPKGIWGDGTYIYVATDWNGIKAYTFDGTNFTLAGSYDTPGNATNVWGDGTYIYVADKGTGVYAFTFDGTTFTFEGSYNTPDSADSVWGDGTYIYVADDSTGVLALSFDGTTFTLAGSYDTPDQAHKVWGQNGFIFVANGTTGVYAFEFDGVDFTVVDNFDTTADAISVWGDDDYIYVGDTNNVVSFSGFGCLSYQNETRLTHDALWGVNKTNPEAKLHSGNRIRSDEGIMIGNDTSCASGEDIGVLRYVGTPAEPFEVCDGSTWQGLSTYDSGVTVSDSTNCSPISFNLLNVEGVALNTDIDTNKIIIGGLSEPCNLTVASDASSITINKNGSDVGGTIVSVDNGDVIYLKVRSSNTENQTVRSIVSVGDKTDEMTVTSECTFEMIEEDTHSSANIDGAREVLVKGDLAFVTGEDSDSFTSFDISDPTNIIELDSISSANLDNPYYAVINGNYAYVTSYVSSPAVANIVVIDISDPTNMVEVDTLVDTDLSNVYNLEIKDNYLFASGYNRNSFVSIDISNPTNISIQDKLIDATNLNWATLFRIKGDYAFIGTWTSGRFTSVDLSDPTNLSIADSVIPSVGGRPHDVEIMGHYAFVINRIIDAVTAYDISDPTNLVEVDSITSVNFNEPTNMIIEGKYAFVTNRDNDEITVLDISDPTNMVEVDNLASLSWDNPRAINFKDGYLYIAGADGDSLTSVEVKCHRDRTDK